jgi:tryptophanyl-tRNA synthetase
VAAEQEDAAATDADGNNVEELGKITMERSRELFDSIDMNANGKVDYKEFKAHVARMINEHRKAFQEDVHAAHSDEL